MEIITYNENNHKNTIIMKTKNLLVVAFAGLIALAACKKEPSVTPTADNSINLSASVYGFTKATDTAFEAGDKVGVNVFAGEEAYIYNAEFAYDNGTLTSETYYEWYDEEELEATITAYYPYDATLDTYGVQTFAVKADQTKAANYQASDLLVASATSLPTEQAVNLEFKHALSKVVVNVENLLKEEVTGVWFSNVYTTVTFDPKNPTELTTTAEAGTVKAHKVEDNQWLFIIAPQADVNPTLTLTTESDKQYSFVLTENVTFSTGKVSTANVSVSTETIYVDFETSDIENWEAENELKFTQDYNLVVELPEVEAEPEFCTLVIKVNKEVDWYDKYVYTWGIVDADSNEWPGAKTEFLKEEGEYYVYFHNFDVNAAGTEINYIVNGGNNMPQTNDLTVTLNAGETVVTIETTDVKAAPVM